MQVKVLQGGNDEAKETTAFCRDELAAVSRPMVMTCWETCGSEPWLTQFDSSASAEKRIYVF